MTLLPLLKRILYTRWYTVEIGSALRKKCDNYFILTFSQLYFKRSAVSETNHLENKIKFNENKKLHIPMLQGINIPSNNRPTDENVDAITSTDISLLKKAESDILEPCQEDISDIAPFVSPSYDLAAYVNNSYTLQQFVNMGVQLHKVERKKGAAEFILKLDFEKHVKPYLRFLYDVGVPAEEFGRFLTINPFIFDQLLEDLEVRVNYLESKKFSPDGLSRIISRNPFWLNFSTIDIDKRLGFFQRSFVLSGDEVRELAVKRPSLITYSLGKVSLSLFAVKEEMGFDDQETKALLLKKPKIFALQTMNLKSRFDYVHNIMGISHEQILQQPGILLFRQYVVKQRHEFLEKLGKAQYDSTKPGYVALDTLVHGSDVDFCKNVAKTSIDVFNAFLKTC